MDHQYSYPYSQQITFNESDINEEHMEIENTVNISIPEKVGDNYLIQLYRERRFLYDKSDRSFKDNKLKNNAWKEISSIMKDKSCGNFYTPEYCKKRITSLREQYLKLKKEQQLKSGSAVCTKKKSELLSELSFLDTYIQRRRTLTNVKESGKMPASSSNRHVECPEANVTENINMSKRNADELLSSQDDMKDDSTENLCGQMPIKIKKSAALKRNNDENVLLELTNAAMNIATQLQYDSKPTENVGSTSVEHAFAEFISLSLEKMEEPERSLRRNKLFYVLTAPLQNLQ